MKTSPRRRLIAWGTAFLIVTAGAVAGRQIYISGPGYGIPYYSGFTPGADARWTALGGTWEVEDGSMRNDSNDRGAKLLAGSPNWKDYVVEADVQLLGAGSAGVLARVSEAEEGENAFKGYFLGVRSVDNSLVLGAFDFAYHEAAKAAMPETVRPFRWYHVRLQVNGCEITASARAEGMEEVRTAPLLDPECFQAGGIALRTNGTGGIWRNVSVTPVGYPAGGSRRSLLPVPEPPVPQETWPDGAAPPPAPQTMRSLVYLPRHGSPQATVRGSVILTRPALYVQDSTGGVEIRADSALPLKIGDEVEITGEVTLDQFGPVLHHARWRRLREAVPLSPLVFSAHQLADGYYDGRFVQVDGYLRSISAEKDGTVGMDLDAGTQSFHAILPRGRSQSLLPRLAPESRLRLRGVSVADARFNKTADPFVILVRSAEDVDVVAGPPWWSPSTMVIAGLVGLGLAFAVNYLYLLAKHWRLRAVAEERERLAHEIHDTLAQSFAGIGFQLQAIRNSVPRGAEPLESQVEQALVMTRTSHGEARRSIARLRPHALEQTGLLPALRECAEQMVKNGNVVVIASGEEGARTVPPRVKDTLYRIGQEAIANAIRHANPGVIRIVLQRTRRSVLLSIEDDGRGFPVERRHTGFGFAGMQKRAESISAALAVRSTPGAGTRVEVQAPVRSSSLLGMLPHLHIFTKDL